jgi:hypothetical protein
VVKTITNNGASENAQKNARDAPVVVALSETQLRAAHFARTIDREADLRVGLNGPIPAPYGDGEGAV